MTVARASFDWLTLREPADADARSTELVDLLLPSLGPGRLLIHDMGCGTGSMRRWLSALLPADQHWIEHDRDVELLSRASSGASASHGHAVTFETRASDITRIPPAQLRGASLITASALLDMFTYDELERFVHMCVAAGCPTLLTLSVIGRVELDPQDDLDLTFMQAFNDHQLRDTPQGRLIGPTAANYATELLTSLGATTTVRRSTWPLDASCGPLLAEWFDGWMHAAVVQRPDLAAAAAEYTRQRRQQMENGTLRVQVHHADILAVPR